MTSIIKKLLWLITGFGFFGMIPLSREPDIRKNGIHSINIMFPLGIGQRKVLSSISHCRKIAVTECDGVVIRGGGLGFMPSVDINMEEGPKQLFHLMRNNMIYALNLHVDGKEMKNVVKKFEKMGCRVDVEDVTDEVLQFVDRRLHNKITQEVADFLRKHIKEEMEECPMCGEGGYPFNNVGECNNCDYDADDNFNISKMIQMRKRGKPIKPIAA